MRLILMGPPGVGKGTQAKRISAEMGIPKISTGDILRDNIHRETELGLKVKSYLDLGDLVPDQVILEIVEDRLVEEDCRPGYILDGFPRTVAQAKGLDEVLESSGSALSGVVVIEVPTEDIVHRLSARFTCDTCGADYNRLTGEVPKICGVCAGTVGQRHDDTEETVRHRLEVYQDQTSPLINYYEDRGMLKRIDGNVTVDEAYRAILSALA